MSDSFSRQYDVLVCGGGPAGIGAAYGAASAGARTLLLEGSGRLGGMAVQAMVGPFMGGVRSRVVDAVMAAVGGRTIDFCQLDLLLYDLLAGLGVQVLLHAPVLAPVMDGQRLRGVDIMTKTGPRRFTAALFIDATGDGDLAYMAGVPFEMGRAGDGLVQPASIMFTIRGIDPQRRFVCGSEEEARRRVVNGRTWEEWVTDAQRKGELPAPVGVVRLYATRQADENGVNATQINGVNGLDPVDLTRAEVEGRRQACQIVAFLRRSLPGYENATMAMMPAVVGVRETRRFCGLARLEKEDCLRGANFADAVVFAASFPIDIHNPAGSGQAAGLGDYMQGEAERGKPYEIPYGCLVPKDVEGLLLAGRCISASHEAHASLRVMCIAMATGAAAGAAAAWAAQHGVSTRAVPVAELQPRLRPE
ncbi:FAD-dependent oxidoreductase [Oligosphaera ethanolica]|uniref:FAD-dependent oxidoreductase n=1 Tax=Oligosphaera ethanolica TaxID=760260 RepID=A0AAE4AMA4_9BACT|nr:FAD-dependent oxidoreductase [Oligosphaera ethanolica]MDQ0288281.1 hypothetical protein [Oligosphaera ethanolica]